MIKIEVERLEYQRRKAIVGLIFKLLLRKAFFFNTNAREAYTALYHSVFNGISKDDEYRVLYQALNDYGGEYAAMAAYLEVNFNQGQE